MTSTPALPVRKIIHIDMDAFYASAEQRDHPEWRGQPIAVGGSRERGVVAAASYEARSFGVRSAMSSQLAYQKCPEIIFVKPRFEVYKEVSRQIRQIFFQYTDLVEPLSLDEAYLDVTSNKLHIPSAQQLALSIKQQIHHQLGLTASAGVSFSKFIAKIASDYQKPNGLTVITPPQADAFIAALPIDKFHGIGRVTAQKMRVMGIHTGSDLRQCLESDLVRHFGKVGHFYYQIAHTIDDRPVNPNRLRKSVGAENTFDHDLTDPHQIRAELQKIGVQVLERMHTHGSYGKTLTLKVKFADFHQITRSRTAMHPILSLTHMHTLTDRLLEEVPWEKAVRLLGLTISGLEKPGLATNAQLSLFS